MRTDVKTLIQALTTERNSLDRAITALRQMSPEVPEPVKAPRAVKTSRRRRRLVFATPDPVRRQIVARMLMAKAQGESMGKTSRELARETGLSAQTIATSWQTWGRAYEAVSTTPNGNDTIVATPEPELAGAIQ